jgi:hypothetical protein
VPILRHVIAAPAPDHAIARGRAGAGLLAHIVVSKYDDHRPCIGRARSSLARASTWKPPPYRGGSGSPAALFCYSPDRKGEHPQGHLRAFRGIIYAGFN